MQAANGTYANAKYSVFSFRDPMSDHPKCRPTMDIFGQCICLSVTPSTINFKGRENCQVYSRSFPSLLCRTRAHHHSSPKYISSDYIWRSIIDHLLYYYHFCNISSGGVCEGGTIAPCWALDLTGINEKTMSLEVGGTTTI